MLRDRRDSQSKSFSGWEFVQNIVETLRVCHNSTWDELHKASVTEHFGALRYATVRYQKGLCGAS